MKLLVLSTVLLINQACDPDPAAPAVPTPAVAPLQFGVLPAVDELTTTRRYRALTQALSEALERPVELLVAKDYGSLVEHIRTGRVHFAQYSPYMYVSSNTGVPVIAQQRMRDENEYCGVFVTREDAPYESIEDLKGKTFAYVSYNSSAGYFYPRLHLRQAGMNPDRYFGNITMAGSHQDVAQLVSKGEVEAGAMSWRTLPEALNLKVVARTDTIPDDVIVASPTLDADTRERAARALLGSDKNETLTEELAKHGIAGFSKADIGLYQPLQRELGMLKTKSKTKASTDARPKPRGKAKKRKRRRR